MAQRVREHVVDGKGRVLVHCGMHHAFTRYLLVERSTKGRVTEFMDRFGNILWRRFGQEVFLVALHKPMWCGPESDPAAKSCPPLDGPSTAREPPSGAPSGSTWRARPSRS